MREGLRALAAGQVGVALLFALDALDSTRLFRRSTRRIRTDADTLALLTDAVVDYTSRVALAHAVLGVLLGGLLHWGVPCLGPRLTSGWRWWRRAAILFLLIAASGHLHQLYVYPAMYDSIPKVAPLVDSLTLAQIQLTIGSVWLVALAVILRRWVRQGAGELKRLGRATVPLALWSLLVGLALSNPSPTESRDNQAMNVVILGVDSLRPDHLGHYGYNRDTAPHIDALLRESVTFDSAWTPLARTYPAWTSILSGRLPINSGIRDNLPVPDEVVPRVPLLPAVLKEQGFTTTFVTDDSRFSYMLPEMGWDRIVQPPPNLKNFAVSLNEPRFRTFAWLMHNPLGFSLLPTAAYNQAFSRSYRPLLFIDRAVDALGETTASGDPFFYAVHSCVLHAPAERPYPWHQMFGQRGYDGSNRFRYSKSGSAIVDGESKKKTSKKDKARIATQDLRIYDSGIDMADQMVGRVVEELKRSGLWDNTIVILLSDHGEEHYEPGQPVKFSGPNHGFHSYGDGQHRVVWAIRTPDNARAGTAVQATVRLFDLVPTLMDLLGMTWPGDLDGASALEADEEESPREVYIETGVSEPRYWTKGHRRYPFKRLSAKYAIDEQTGRVNIKESFMPHLIAAKDRVMQVGRWKLIWHAMAEGHKVELFDRDQDPTNTRPVTEQHPEVVADLMKRMAPYLQRDGIEVPFELLGVSEQGQ